MRNTWKGVQEEEVGKIPMDVFMKLITSRARRTLERLNSHPKLKAFYEKLRNAQTSKKKKPLKTHVREAIILPEMVGMEFLVYNGKEYKKIVIDYTMLGLRLGDFSHTTTRVLHSGPGVGATRGSKFVPLK